MYEDDEEPEGETPFAEDNFKGYGVCMKEINSAPVLNRNPSHHNLQAENTDFVCHPEATDFWYPELHEDLEESEEGEIVEELEEAEIVDKPLQGKYQKSNYLNTRSIESGPPVFSKSSPASSSSFNSEAENITPPSGSSKKIETKGLPVFDKPPIFSAPRSTTFDQESETTSLPFCKNQGLGLSIFL